MPMRQPVEPFTWHSAAPRAGWAQPSRVAVLCAIFAAGGYALGHTGAPPDVRPIIQTAAKVAAHTVVPAAEVRVAAGGTAATVAPRTVVPAAEKPVAAGEPRNAGAEAAADKSALETPSRMMQNPKHTPDSPPVVLLNPNSTEVSKQAGPAVHGSADEKPETTNRSPARTARPLPRHKSAVKEPPRSLPRNNANSAKPYGYVAAPRLSSSRDDYDDAYEAPRGRDYRDLRAKMLLGAGRY